MLLNFKTGAIATVLGVATLAGSVAHAEEHIVMVLGSSYFPAIAYVDPGDTVRFVNASETLHIVSGSDGDWTTGIMQSYEEVVIPVVADMTLTYFGDEARTIEGKLDFGNAPIN